MPRLRRLSGAELVRIFRGFGYVIHSQRGSHIKLRRTRADGTAETLIIPASVAHFRLRNRGGGTCKVVKAFVR